MKAKAAAHLRGIKLYELVTLAKRVQTNLQNPLFSGIVPAPAEVMPKIVQLNNFWLETERKNYSYIPQRDELADEIKTILSLQCMAVNGLAQGSLYILERSGFDLARKASSPGIAAPPDYVKVGRGREPWHVKVRFTRVPSRQYYEVLVTDAAGNDHHYSCRNTTLFISDLAPNQEIRIRVRAINSCGEGEYTCPTSYYISPGVRRNATPQVAK